MIKTRYLNTLREQVSDLINKSVQDMESGLWAYSRPDLPVLKAALKSCKRRGEKTKANILAGKIKKLEEKNADDG